LNTELALLGLLIMCHTMKRDKHAHG